MSSISAADRADFLEKLRIDRDTAYAALVAERDSLEATRDAYITTKDALFDIISENLVVGALGYPNCNLFEGFDDAQAALRVTARAYDARIFSHQDALNVYIKIDDAHRVVLTRNSRE